jgi:hypothetical protein
MVETHFLLPECVDPRGLPDVFRLKVPLRRQSKIFIDCNISFEDKMARQPQIYRRIIY